MLKFKNDSMLAPNKARYDAYMKEGAPGAT
jgi:hypothetical protein